MSREHEHVRGAKTLDLRSVFGVEARVTAPAEATDGAYVELDCGLAPGGSTSIHYHPEQDEEFEILEGDLEVYSDGAWHSLPAGRSMTVPKGSAHGFRNTGSATVRFRNVHRPALAFQEHLETLERLIQAGKIKGLRDPRSLMYMAIASVEQEPSVAVKPPQGLLRLLAFIGRRLGYSLPARQL